MFYKILQKIWGLKSLWVDIFHYFVAADVLGNDIYILLKLTGPHPPIWSLRCSAIGFLPLLISKSLFSPINDNLLNLLFEKRRFLYLLKLVFMIWQKILLFWLFKLLQIMVFEFELFNPLFEMWVFNSNEYYERSLFCWYIFCLYLVFLERM